MKTKKRPLPPRDDRAPHRLRSTLHGLRLVLDFDRSPLQPTFEAGPPAEDTGTGTDGPAGETGAKEGGTDGGSDAPSPQDSGGSDAKDAALADG